MNKGNIAEITINLVLQFIYNYTRNYFIIKWPTDIFILLIIITIVARFIVLWCNNFKYTQRLLFKNNYGYYV